ncbi:Uncharacterised protein [Vibrio cholerae]|uniref:Uncharacterized protein n=1 Tax=Vibrio cholerae TaxID=666 RepID=A0A655NUP3_VIBCL|nr:Uncharacterised protein [Vibrio cholerae]
MIQKLTITCKSIDPLCRHGGGGFGHAIAEPSINTTRCRHLSEFNRDMAAAEQNTFERQWRAAVQQTFKLSRHQ